MMRPRLIQTKKFLGCRDQGSSRLETFMDVKTETHQDLEISWMLIQNSSRLGDLLDVETHTSLDWVKNVDTETPSRLSIKCYQILTNVNKS